MVHRYKPELYQYVEYLVRNYTEDNFKRWRKYVVMSICMYFYIATYIITVSNESIRMMIIEFIFCYHVIELYERYYNIKIYQKKEFECKTNKVSIFDDDYHSELFDIKKS